MMHYTCSKEVWDTTRDLVGASTRSKITLYRIELQKIRKGNMKMEEYLNKIKSISDCLALASSLVSHSDLIL